LSDKNFKVKNKLTIAGLTNSAGVLIAEGHTVDSHTNLATQYGGTGTTTSPSSGQILYSSSGTTYAPTTLTSLVTPVTYSADAPASPVTGQIWVESDSSADSFDPNIIRRQAFTATAAQTVFTTSIAFIEGYEQVYFNGLLLLRGTDYTTSNSNTVTLSSGAAVNDIVEVVTVTNLNSVNTYTQGEIDTALSAKLSTSTAASTYLTQSNASSTYLTPGTAASTYLSQSNAATTYVPQTSYSVAGKNAVINGGFDYWQRGTSLALTSGQVYLADRFKATCRNGAGTQSRYSLTLSESATCANLKYAYQFDIATGATNASPRIYHVLEDAFYYHGRTMTVSFYAKASKSITVGASADLIFNNADNMSSTLNASLTTSWQRFSYTFTLSPSGTYNSATDYGLILVWDTPMNDTYTVYMTGVQIENGSTMTPFSRAGGTLQGELAACQRYYQKSFQYSTAPANNTNDPLGPVTFARQATSGAVEPQMWVQWKTQMRSAPSVTLYNLYSGTAGQWTDGSTTGANARCFNISDTAANIDNTDVTITLANAVIHYAASAEL